MDQRQPLIAYIDKNNIMKKTKSLNLCRVCGSENVKSIRLDISRFLSPYLSRSNLWRNYFCQNCNSVSHYPRENSSLIRYSDSSYRKESTNTRPQSPISLPWSTITSLRSRHISILLNRCKESLDLISDKKITLLDYGGYNGFTAYGLRSYYDISNTIVADLDPNGLKIASSLGMEVIDLSKSNINRFENNVDLCICVQVLEHLERPSIHLADISQCLTNQGLLYIEVPNLYGSTFSEPSHLISYTKYSIFRLVKDAGFNILDIGFTSTPREAIKYGYPSSSWRECIYCIAIKDKFLERDIQNKDLPKTNHYLISNKSKSFSKNSFIIKLTFNNLIYSFTYPYNLLVYLSTLFLRLLKEIIRLVFSPIASLFFLVKNLIFTRN